MFFSKKPKYTWESSFMISAITVFVGFIGSLFIDLGKWYQNLPHIPLQPPNWVFGPVWTFIYILIAWSAVIVANSKSRTKVVTLFLYGMNGMLNFLWTVFFFTVKDVRAAFLEISLLWVTIIGMIFFSARISKKAAILLIPYLVWVTFAAYLNYSYMTAMVAGS